MLYSFQLGCGTSLPGIVAAKVGSVVTLTDSEDLPLCLERARESCKANDLDNVTITSLTWGICSPQLLSLPPVDIILGSDCFYDTEGYSITISPCILLILGTE